MEPQDIQRVYEELITSPTQYLPNVMVANGACLNAMLETDDYDERKTYYVTRTGIFEVLE